MNGPARQAAALLGAVFLAGCATRGGAGKVSPALRYERYKAKYAAPSDGKPAGGEAGLAVLDVMHRERSERGPVLVVLSFGYAAPRSVVVVGSEADKERAVALLEVLYLETEGSGPLEVRTLADVLRPGGPDEDGASARDRAEAESDLAGRFAVLYLHRAAPAPRTEPLP